MQGARRKSTKQLINNNFNNNNNSNNNNNQNSFRPEVEAIDVGGIYLHAICNNGKVDIINVDDGRYIQSILEKNPVLVSWSLRTSHLAILTFDYIVLFECIFDQGSFKPYWSKLNTIDIKTSITNFNINNIRSISFQYPYISILHGDTITLHNCINVDKFHTLSSASGIPSIAKLSYSGRVLALCSFGSSRIDFMSIHKSGCSPLSHKDHSSEIISLSWRPGYSTTRDLVLACDVTNLIRIWAVEYLPSYRSTEVHADIHLLLELGDYVGSNTICSWVLHGLTTHAELAFLCDSLGRDVSKIGSLTSPSSSSLSSSSSSSLSLTSSSNSTHQLINHLSGSWLAILDEAGIVRFWCIHSHGVSNHIECTLKGHGPGINTSKSDNELQFHSFAIIGRFTPLGADRPVNVQIVTAFIPNTSIQPNGNFNYSKQIIKYVSAESEQRLTDFVLITSKTYEFQANLLTLIKYNEKKSPESFTTHLPTNWSLQTWSTYQLGESDNDNNNSNNNNNNNNFKNDVIPKSFRSLYSPWGGIESSLWCWINRHRPITKYTVTNSLSPLSTLQFDPIEIAAAFPGHEVSHEILRSLWIPLPLDTLTKDNDEKKKDEQELPYCQLMITLQQPRYRSYIVAVWKASQPDENIKSRFTNFSLTPRDDNIINSRGSFDHSTFFNRLQRGDTKISSSQAGIGGFDSYEVSLIPDPHFGLGLRLDVDDGKILVESFKRNPLTMKPMPAEESGIIGIGDELISVSGTNLKGHTLAEVIQTIRHVVQSERGSAITLRLRASTHQNGDDSLSMNSRTFSTTNSSRWYDENDQNRGKSILDSNLSNSQNNNNNNNNNIDNNELDKNKIENNHLNIQIPHTYNWKLLSSCNFDDVILMDITLSATGSSLSNGILLLNNLSTIGAGVVLRKFLNASGQYKELSVFELILRNGELLYIQRAISSWHGDDPYSIQIWSNSPNTFVISAMRILDHSEADITHFLSLYYITAPPNSPYYDECDLNRNQATDAIPGGISRNISDNLTSTWSITSEITLPISLLTSSLTSLLSNNNNNNNNLNDNLNNIQSSNTTIDFNSNQWIPFNLPFENGNRYILLGSHTTNQLLIIYLSGSIALSSTDVHNHYKKRRKSRSGSLTTEDEKSCKYNAIGKCTQVITCESNIKWANFLNDVTLQIAGDNHLELYIKNDDTGIWTKIGTTTFNGIDSPGILTDKFISSPSPWSYGALTTQPEFTTRGFLGNLKPDWHPLYIALELFSISGNSGKYSRNFPLILQSNNDNNNNNNNTSSISTTINEWSLDILHSLYSCFCRFELLKKSIEITLANPSAYYMTKLIEVPTTLSLNTIPDIVNLMKDTAKRILRNSESYQTLVTAIKFLPGPLQLLTPDEIVALCVQCIFLIETLPNFKDILNCNTINNNNDNNVNNDTTTTTTTTNNNNNNKIEEINIFKNMDEWACHSIIAYRCLNILHQLATPPEKNNLAIANGTIVLNALVSNSQTELYRTFIGEEVDSYLNTQESVLAKSSKDFHFGMLWWARNQVGKDANTEIGEFDILKSLTHLMVPLWLRDIEPIYELIEKLSADQFRDHRDSMKIFMEMVVIGKSTKLLQLAKTDRNIMGKQLQNLLSMDFTSEKGRVSAHKNAFALLRLQRYKHAAAVFLCTEPPMLKEAIRVITKHLHDPFLALLVARLVENRMSPRLRTGGYVLGPITRKLIISDILPLLHNQMKVLDGHSDTYKLKDLNVTPHWGVDAAMLAISCCLWLQDTQLFIQTVNMCSQYDIFRTNPNCSHLGYSEQLFGSCGALKWLTSQTIYPDACKIFGYSLDIMCEGYGVNDLRFIGQDITYQHSPNPNSIQHFIQFCDKSYQKWLEDVRQYNSEQLSSKAVVNSNKQINNSNSTEEEDEISLALKKFNKMKGITSDDFVVESAKTSKGFNFSATDKPKSSEPPNMLDMFDAPPAPKPKPKQSEPANMLDMFDTVPPAPKPKPKPSEPPNMLDMFDAPPPKPKPKSSEPPNMLDMFDAPPPKPKPKSSEPPNMLDMFDAPPPKPKPKSSEPPNMLDMFDAPPPKPKPKSSEPPNMLDMFDAPPAPKPKPKPSEPANMLDMFDAPPPQKPKPSELANNIENSESTIDETPVHQLSDIPDIAVTEFLSLSSIPKKVYHKFEQNLNTIMLTSTTRQSIVVRCLTELQLSLGHIPTMDHPLALSGSSRELLNIILEDIESSLYSDFDRLISFRRCLRSLSQRYIDLVTLTIPTKTHLSDDCLLAHFLLENLEVYQPTDSLVLRVLLCWAVGQTNNATKMILAAIVSIHEMIPIISTSPLSSSSTTTINQNLSLTSALSNATTIYFIILIRQLQLLLSLNTSPQTSKYLLPEGKFSSAIISLIGLTVRIALAFVSLDFRYDITQKLLRFPPRFPTATTDGESNTTTDTSTNEYENWLKQNPIEKSDPGHLYFRPLSRPEAIEALQGLPKGTFLIRPHESQEDVVFLSFVAGGTDGIRHAIIRNDGGLTGQPQYRCGKVGPCATIDITLRSISKILPSSLNFNPNIVNGGPSSFGTNIFNTFTDKNSISSNNKADDSSIEQSSYGSFNGDIPIVTPTSNPPKTSQDLSWDPNGDFWWDYFMEENEDDLIVQSSFSYKSQYITPDNEKEIDGVNNTMTPSTTTTTTTTTTTRTESFMEAITALRESEKKKGIMEIAIGRGNNEKNDETSDELTRLENEELKNLKVQLQLYEHKEIEPKWTIPLPTDPLGSLIRSVTHMLAIKTIYKQLTGQLDDLKVIISRDINCEQILRQLIILRFMFKFPIELLPYSISSLTNNNNNNDNNNNTNNNNGNELSNQIEKPSMKKQNSVERFKHSANFSPSKNTKVEKNNQILAKLTSIESLFIPISQFVYTTERIVLTILCPPLPLDPTAFISADIAAGEALMEQILHEKIGVPLRHVKLQSTGGVSGVGVVGTSHPALSTSATGVTGSEHVVECMESGDAMDWICKHTDESTLQAIMHTKTGDILKPEHVLKWLWDRRILQNIVLEVSGVYQTRQHFFRYIDPWEVSIVADQSTVLSSARLGRGWYGPVSSFSAISLIDTVGRYMRLQNQGKDGGFMKLWESLRAEAWLVMSISTAHEQGEREAGGPIVTELTSTSLGSSDPYHSCLARHLYRNALFSRLCMPHRFVAVLQIDTFALKDLSPQKFMAGVASTPIEVYAILRLVRSSGKWKASEHRRTLADTIVTPARKIEPNKQLVTSQPSEYAWREQAVMRFPLPDRVLAISPFVEGGERNMRQPPRKLQIAVYETRSFFSDTKLGELELPLSGLSDDRPFRDWLPLSSEKGAAWFVHVQMQLRFLLMTKDSNRDSTIRSNKGKSTLVKKDGDRKNTLKTANKNEGSRNNSPSQVINDSISPSRSSIVHSAIMYPNPNEVEIDSQKNPSSNSFDGKSSRLDELGDFF